MTEQTPGEPEPRAPHPCGPHPCRDPQTDLVHGLPEAGAGTTLCSADARGMEPLDAAHAPAERTCPDCVGAAGAAG